MKKERKKKNPRLVLWNCVAYYLDCPHERYINFFFQHSVKIGRRACVSEIFMVFFPKLC